MHVTCQHNTPNFYTAQHFKIKENYAVKHPLRPDNNPANTTICLLEETVKSAKDFFLFFQLIACR
ncbi:hypothetical protein EIC82_22000 [Enterobacter sp. A11]|nr:hypothetical protein EIC82_22000 [Enterobacter sp. A11]